MKKPILAILAAIAFLPVYGQEAAVVSDILSRPVATVMDMSYLVASASGVDCTPFEAYAFCDQFGVFPLTRRPDAPVTVRDASYFFMSAYGLKGGIMWNALKNPRYAWKELKANGFWKQGTDPGATLSGRDLVRAVGKFYETWPDAKLRVPTMIQASDQNRKALLAGEESAQ